MLSKSAARQTTLFTFHIIRTFQTGVEALELENGQPGLHSVRLLVICESLNTPIVINSDYQPVRLF